MLLRFFLKVLKFGFFLFLFLLVGGLVAFSIIYFGLPPRVVFGVLFFIGFAFLLVAIF